MIESGLSGRHDGSNVLDLRFYDRNNRYGMNSKIEVPRARAPSQTVIVAQPPARRRVANNCTHPSSCATPSSAATQRLSSDSLREGFAEEMPQCYYRASEAT